MYNEGPDYVNLLPVSGRYEGEMTQGKPDSDLPELLELRVDIDPRYNYSPVLNIVSGDFYQNPRTQRIYRRKSWIVDKPTISKSQEQVKLTGMLEYYRGTHPQMEVSIVISPDQNPMQAEASFSQDGHRPNKKTYLCKKKSDHFRQVTLGLEVCKSVKKPFVPSYDTHALKLRPPNLPQRKLTIEQAYLDAGIDIKIIPHSINKLKDDSWEDDDLYQAMKKYYDQVRVESPEWHIWCLLARKYYKSHQGLMFDFIDHENHPPDRQGCAIFIENELRWFKNLPSGKAKDDGEALGLLQFLFAYVHEIGHVFNLPHTFLDHRPGALSWMNYPEKYNGGGSENKFWEGFRFMFDRYELIHLRHGDWFSVIPGGEDFLHAVTLRNSRSL